jgi:uncharacterized protein YjiS (DUF1127 family)
MRYQLRQRHPPNKAMSNVLDNELADYIAEARRLRAEVMASVLAAAAASTTRLLRAAVSPSIKLARRAVGWFAREHERRVGLRALMALDDHTLKDIGLSRREIHAMVDGVFRAPEVGRPEQRERAPTLVVNKENGAANAKTRRAA